ncbi:tetratricopeptide repeat protein [Lysobacter sp. P5_B9]
MTVKWLFGAALLLCFNSAVGCVNTVGTGHDGRRFRPDGPMGEELAASINNPAPGHYVLADAKDIIARASTKRDFGALTDLGVLLIYQGQYAQAIRLFLTIERRFPGHPETAANLGTTLELAGHDATALQWIRIGIQRNAEEHDGTEWLHARILEAKLAAAKDPTYLDRHSVAGVTFEDVLVPAIPGDLPAGNSGKPVKPWELNIAFAYQLQERTGFVKPRDPIVANLLRDWATLNLAGGPVESADVLYDFALTYGAKPDALMRNRQAYIKRVLAQAGDAEPEDDATCAICWRERDLDESAL